MMLNVETEPMWSTILDWHLAWGKVGKKNPYLGGIANQFSLSFRRWLLVIWEAGMFSGSRTITKKHDHLFNCLARSTQRSRMYLGHSQDGKQMHSGTCCCLERFGVSFELYKQDSTWIPQEKSPEDHRIIREIESNVWFTLLFTRGLMQSYNSEKQIAGSSWKMKPLNIDTHRWVGVFVSNVGEKELPECPSIDQEWGFSSLPEMTELLFLTASPNIFRNCAPAIFTDQNVCSTACLYNLPLFLWLYSYLQSQERQVYKIILCMELTFWFLNLALIA